MTPRRSARERWRSAVPWLRTFLVVGAGAAVVAGAGQLPEPADLGERWVTVEGEPPAGVSSQAVREVTLGCPGPEQLGLEDATVEESRMVVFASAVSPPPGVLPDGVEPAGSGYLALERVPGGPPQESVTARGESITHAVEDAHGVVARADGRLAPGLTAGQWHLSRSELRRGMTAAPCTVPTTDAWLVAGGGEPGRLERLVLVNPADDAVTVEVEVLGAEGRLAAPGGQGIVVPGRDRSVILLDALAPGEQAPVVHVTSTGGPVVPTLADRWLEGTLDRGLELTTPVAAPGTSLVVPAVPVPEAPDAGRAALRVAAPGEVQAIVQVRALTGEGPARVDNDVTVVSGGTVVDIDLATLPEGTRALEVTSDEPVVAALTVERRGAADGPADMTWVPATPPITQLAGAALLVHPEVETGSHLWLASLGGAVVDVMVLHGEGELTTEQVEVPAAGAVTTNVTGRTAVWVRPRQGEVHAAVVGTDPDARGGTLLATYPLRDLPVSHELLPVQPWRR